MNFFVSRIIEFIFFCLLALELSRCWRANVFSLGIQGFSLVTSYSIVAFSQIFVIYLGINHGILGRITFLIFSVFGASIISTLLSNLFYSVFKKLKDDYFAIATLAFAQFLLIFVTSFDFLGGAKGYSLNHSIDFGNIVANRLFFLLLLVLLFIVYLVLAKKNQKSFSELIITATGENELGAQHLGIDTVMVRKNVFVQCGFWTGISGAIMANYYVFISPDDFMFINSIPILLFVVLGNYSINKTIVYSFSIYFGYELLKSNLLGILPYEFGNKIASLQNLIYGSLLVAAVLLIFKRKNKKAWKKINS